MIQKQESIARASVRALLHYHNYDYICFHDLQRIVAAVCIRQDPHYIYFMLLRIPCLTNA